jgi:hypothetical protein
MNYNRELGKELVHKYLNSGKFADKIKHCYSVGELCYRIALKIKPNFIVQKIDPEFVGFLGYVHDIGQSVGRENHELHTIDILVNKENIPSEIARKTIHGAIWEQTGEVNGEYLPVVPEGLILSYSDMSVKTDRLMTIEERTQDIKDVVPHMTELSEEFKAQILSQINKTYARFKRYEKWVFKWAGVSSVYDFEK